jgi:hypothetical protein
MNSIAARLTLILRAFRTAVIHLTIRQPKHVPVLDPVCGHLARAALRFERLFNRWRLGTLPAPRPAAPSTPGATPTPPAAPAPREAAKKRARLPSGRGWLIYTFRELRFARRQLEHWFAAPDLPAFLAEVPQAGRILRPLCHLVDLAPAALPPPRPPAAPPATPKLRPLTRQQRKAALWYPNQEGQPASMLHSRKFGR